MTVELMSVITIFSIACSAFFGYAAFMRNKKTDDKMDATQITTVIVKLDNIESTVNEIKLDSKSFKHDIQELREKVLLVDQRLKNVEEITYRN